MRLPRFRIRTLMIAVAVAGILLATAIEAARLRRVSMKYRARAAELALQGRFLRGFAEINRLSRNVADIQRSSAGPASTDLVGRQLETLQQDSKRLERRIEHAAALKRKYERAAQRPWETVPPDLPEPR